MISRPAYSVLELVPHADDGGNTHRAGKDGGVARTGAALGDEAEDLALVELDGLAGGEIVRRQDHGHIAVDTALHRAGQNADDAVGHVADIRRARLHIGVVHRGEHIRKLLAHVAEHRFSIQPAADRLLDGLLVIEILCHQLVRLKQQRRLIARLGARLFGERAQLLDGPCLRILEAFPLRLDVRHGGADDLSLCALIEIERTGCNAGGYAFSLDRDHGLCSPLKKWS